MWQVFPIDKGWATALAGLVGLIAGWGLAVLADYLPRRLEALWQAQAVEAQSVAPRSVGRQVLIEGAAEKSTENLASSNLLCRGETQEEKGVDASEQSPIADPAGSVQGTVEEFPQSAAVDRFNLTVNWRVGPSGLALVGLTSLLFALCIACLGPTPVALCGMALVAALLVLAWIDAQTRLLPDALTLPLLWLGLLVNLHGALASLPGAVLGAAAGYLFLWVIFHAFRLITGVEGMGHGDFKLMAALGAWFGLAAAPWLLLGASLAGSAAGLALRASGRLDRGQPLPFGPYLAAGGILMLLIGVPMGIDW